MTRWIAALVVLIHGAAAFPAENEARLYRDTYGVPHIFAESMPAAYYAAGYAMAEDLGYAASQIAIEVEGRQAEFHGPDRDLIREDINARHFRFYRDAIEFFDRIDPEVRKALIAFSEGIERRYSELPRPRPERAIHVTPQHLAATFLMANLYQSAFEAMPHELGQVGVPIRYPYLGSNAWAASPSKMSDGSVMHFAGPQTPFGDAQPEIHLEWPGGRIAGYGYGLFVDPGLGLNHCWGATANWPDTSDVYTFNLNPEDRELYWDVETGDWQRMNRLEFTLKIRGAAPHKYSRWLTRLGPVIRIDGSNRIYVWRAAGANRIEIVNAVFRKQWANSAKEALPVGKPPEPVAGNWILADRDGDIIYLYNARVFGRSRDEGWHSFVRGEDESSRWRDWAFTIGGDRPLPMAVNPPSGFLTSNNEPPWFVSKDRVIRGREIWPPYLVPDEGWGANPTVRGARARELLFNNGQRITPEQAMQFPFDTALPKVQSWLTALNRELEAGGAERLTPEGRHIRRILDVWRGTADADAPGMSAAFYLVQDLRPWSDSADAAAWDGKPVGTDLSGAKIAEAMNNVARMMTEKHGERVVPWGEIHGVPRADHFHPLPGGTDALPAIFQAHAGGRDGLDHSDMNGRVICDEGSSHLSLTFFRGEETIRYSVNPGGQHNPAAHPDSPHIGDQTPLYAAGQFKRFWLTEEEVLENLTPYEGDPGYPLKARKTLNFTSFSSE